MRRHAGASKVSIRVSCDNGLAQLEVVDDGAGFTAAQRERSRADGHVGSRCSKSSPPNEEAPRRRVGARRRYVVRARGTDLVIRVVIADDHAVVRHGLAQLLSTFPDVELVGEAADGEVAVVMCAEHRPDVVLMDLEMPSLDGIEATKRIKPTSQTWPSSSSRRSRTGTGSCRRSTRAPPAIC